MHFGRLMWPGDPRNKEMTFKTLLTLAGFESMTWKTEVNHLSSFRIDNCIMVMTNISNICHTVFLNVKKYMKGLQKNVVLNLLIAHQ